MKSLVLSCLCAVVLAWTSPGQSSPEPRWKAALQGALRRGEPLVVHVVVPLCHRQQIACGGRALGDPASLRSNLYWGALFGVPRFFERRELGYQALPAQDAPEGVLERRAYRRHVSGAPWGRRGPVELVVVLDAIHGARIDDAVRRFHREATEGGTVELRDGEARRRLRVSVSGYAGHNRLMDGLELPAATARTGALPAFVLACYSDKYFAEALERAGSAPLVTTHSLMAPEGYVVEATVRALASNASEASIREAVAQAYAKWQKIHPSAARRMFATPP
jgi:hypothetical protein